jgi:hypothetical protein
VRSLAVTIVLGATASLCAGPAICRYAQVRNPREFRLGADLQHPLGVLARVRLAESRCHKATGYFAPLQELGPRGSGGFEQSILTGADDGFSAEVHAAVDSYSVKVHPMSTARLHSLYLDENGAIHFGTRDWPASADSPLLVPY